MIIVALDGNILKVANLGDSGFRVVRHGKVVLASPAQEHYFNCPFQLGYAPLSEDIDSASEAQEFEFEIQPGDLVIVGSDGLFDNVFDEDIVAVANLSSCQGGRGRYVLCCCGRIKSTRHCCAEEC